MSQKGTVQQFRRGRRRIHEKHFILDVHAKSIADASKYVGKTVIWTSPSGKKIQGKISSPHGSKGMVRAIFEKGLPGQARNTDIEITETSSSTKEKVKTEPKVKKVKVQEDK
ncbi:MAG: 50S ribosomal protein L35ae [Candidatus Pacearchaeota archaeon]|jgi:large subunit ribosomal protein L35Ae